jgi:hypothetical protein
VGFAIVTSGFVPWARWLKWDELIEILLDGFKLGKGTKIGWAIRALERAASGKGHFDLGGSATRAEAEALGQAWVGKGYRTAGDGKILISADGLRQYRPPSYKNDFGSWQANFERRDIPEGSWLHNGHLTINNP